MKMGFLYSNNLAMISRMMGYDEPFCYYIFIYVTLYDLMNQKLSL